ncbi:hypothetical protein [Cellulomonas sp.]|uniref:hypothetical protein n=1 Tax=Cellulomonas sp. TaxID=40001 RepID=UPI001B0C0B4F|nr:hypothetical protein [Cellulomonas sp.]MBO9554706.1 hypothetical protein [Cellulomonas sp.]
MSRPGNWYPLAWSDPVPGDVAVVQRAGADYTNVAKAIQAAATQLAAIADLRKNQSKAVSAVADRADAVAGEIKQAHGRYVAVGRELTTYASALSGAQAESERALRDAQNAESALTAAQARIRSSSVAIDDAPDDIDATDLWRLENQLRHARDDRDAAESAIQAARTRLEGAIADRDRAAEAAAANIRDAVHADKLKDGWLKNVTATLAPVCRIVSEIADVVGSVVGILALALCWVPVLGEVLGLIALVVTAIKLIADLVLALDGTRSWADVGWGVLALATFGAGKVFVSAARSSGLVARALSRLQAGRLGALSPRLRAAAGLPGGSSRQVIRELTGESDIVGRQAMRRAATSGGTFRSALRVGLRELDPRKMFSPFTKLDEISWRSLGQGWDNLRAGAKDWRTMVGALQGDGELIETASTLSNISGDVRGFAAIDELSDAANAALSGGATATNSAVQHTNWGIGLAGGAVGVGVYDTTVGLQETYETSGTVGWGDTAIVSDFRHVGQVVQRPTSLWETPTDRLRLP